MRAVMRVAMVVMHAVMQRVDSLCDADDDRNRRQSQTDQQHHQEEEVGTRRSKRTSGGTAVSHQRHLR